MTITHISNSAFYESKLKYDGICIVECYSSPSGMLQIMEPVFAKVEDELNINFKHLRIDLKRNPFLTEEFLIKKDLTYLFFKNGELTDKIDGLMSINTLKEIIQNSLSN